METQPSSGLPLTHHPPGSRRRVVTKLPLDGGHGRHRCRQLGGAAAASTPPRSQTTMHVGGGRGSSTTTRHLNLIGVITAAVTPRPSGPSPSMTPPPPPQAPRKLLLEEKKLKLQQLFHWSHFRPHSNPPQPSSSAVGGAKSRRLTWKPPLLTETSH